MLKNVIFTENLNLDLVEKHQVDSEKSSTELLERSQNDSEVWVTEYSEQINGHFNKTHENKLNNTTLTKYPEQVNQQALVGVAVVIIALTLISLMILIVHTIKSYKKRS